MKIEGGKVGPCSTCLRVRQVVQDVLSNKKPKTLVECTMVDFVLDNKTHAILSVSHSDFASFVGVEVYRSGRIVYDVKKAKPIGAFGTVIKSTETD